MACWGILGGSGLDDWEALNWVDELSISTPYGEPSAAFRVAILERDNRPPIKIFFLPRHGVDHRFAPHRINYRANLWAMKHAGVQRLLASATVGSIDSDMKPGSICIPDQLIDYTWGREQSFSDDGAVLHIDFTHPFDQTLRQLLIGAKATRAGGALVHNHGVYGCTQGPRLETAAEIARLAADGCTVVGMTAMPEAALARELGLSYALLCLVVNPAAGIGLSAQAIDHDSLKQVMKEGMLRVKSILLEAMKTG